MNGEWTIRENEPGVGLRAVCVWATSPDRRTEVLVSTEDDGLVSFTTEDFEDGSVERDIPLAVLREIIARLDARGGR